MTVVRIAAAALAASAAVVVSAPAASADCTTDYLVRRMMAEQFDYVEVSGLTVTVHGEYVVEDARYEVADLRDYVDCVV